MEEMIYFNLFMIASIFILFIGMNLFINNFNSGGIIYGVRVPNKYRKDERIKKVDKDYKILSNIVVILLTLVFTVIFLITKKMWIVILYMYILIPIEFILYNKSYKSMKKVKEEIGWNKEFENKVYIEIKPKKEEKKQEEFKVKKLWFVISLILAVGSLILTIIKFKSLPEMVPMHFSFNGEADRYANVKTLGGALELFLLPIMNIGMVVLLYVLTVYDNKKRKSGKLNGGTYSQIKLNAELSGKALSSLMGGTSFITALLMVWATLFPLGILKFNKTMSNITMAFTVVIMIYCVGYSLYLMAKDRRKTTYNKDDKEYYFDDDDKFKFGVFYYNDKDPSMIIERRMGMGYDFNYANIKAQILVVILGIIVFGTLIMTIYLNI